MNDQPRTETTYTVQVSQEMLDAVNSYAYMRHYDSGVDGHGMINIAVFHPEGVINSFVNSEEAWVWWYDDKTDPEVIKWNKKLLSLAQQAQIARANYLILESL